jgi:hypothetical protein
MGVIMKMMARGFSLASRWPDEADRVVAVIGGVDAIGEGVNAMSTWRERGGEAGFSGAVTGERRRCARGIAR